VKEKEKERVRERKKRKRGREREKHVAFVKGFLLLAPGSALEKFAHGPGPWGLGHLWKNDSLIRV
jgi:hypothetical protein